MQANIPLRVGDQVVIKVRDVIKQMRDHYECWNDAMEECLVGPCKLIQHDGLEAAVKAPSGRLYRLHSGLLSKYNKPAESILPTAVGNTDRTNLSSTISDEKSLSRYSVGDIVEVINDKNRVKVLQEGHGEWHELMTLILKKKGTVKLIHPNGDLQVEMKGTEIRLNPECVVKVWSDKGDSFLTEKMSFILDDETVSHSGDTPLHVAVRNKNYRLCCQLIAERADVNASNEEGMTPIMLAAQIGRVDVLSLLVQQQGAGLDIGDLHKDTALHLAVQNSNDDAVWILLEAGANIKVSNDQQFTPFHLAALWGHEKILELFLDKYGGSLVDLQKDDKFTALHVAAMNNRTACLRLLIGYNADLNIGNKKMQTALHIAVSMKYMGCVRILVRCKTELDLQDENGDTPLHNAVRLYNNQRRMGLRVRIGDKYASRMGFYRQSEELEHIAIYLVKHGASLDILNSAGESPLTACEDPALRKKLDKMKIKGGTGLEMASLVTEADSEVEGTEQGQNQPDEILCVICLENRADVEFNCGHLACNDCANNIDNFPMRHQRIETGIQIN